MNYHTTRNCILLVLFLFALSVLYGCGATFSEFTAALNQVETGGRAGPIVGDNGKALGPLQIHKSYWQDSGVRGSYNQCADYNYACEVVRCYLWKYCRRDLVTGNWENCARIHNGGPHGYKKQSTKNYWLRVKKHLTA